MRKRIAPVIAFIMSAITISGFAFTLVWQLGAYPPPSNDDFRTLFVWIGLIGGFGCAAIVGVKSSAAVFPIRTRHREA